MKSKFTLCLALLLLAVITSSSGQNDSQKRLTQALEDYQAALNRGDSADLAEKSYILGKRYLETNSVFPAKRYFLQALKIREAKRQYLDVGKIFAVLKYAELFYDDLEGADRYSRLALDNFRKAGTPFALMQGYTNRHLYFFHVVEVAMHNNERIPGPTLDSLNHYAKLALELARQENDRGNVGLGYRSIGQAFFARGQVDSAIENYKRGLLSFNSTKKTPVNQLVGLCFDLSRAFLKKGKKAESGRWLREGLTVSDTSRRLHYWPLASTFALVDDYYRLLGDHASKAAEFRQKRESSIMKFHQNNRKAAEEGLQFFFDNEQKQALLAEQERELAFERRFNLMQSRLVIAVLFFLIFAITASFFLYRLYKKFRALSEENAVLLNEQNHRIKNNLQSVYSLLELQSMQVEDPKAQRALAESMMRVETIVRVHQELCDGGRLVEVPLQKYIPDLVRGVLRSYSRQDIDITYELDAIWLRGEKAIPLGLILNELITNACKYAFPTTASPALTISCRQQNAEIGLAFRDNGTGFECVPSEAPNGTTLGLTLVRLLVGKLKGTSDFTSDTNGTAFRLTFPTVSEKATVTS